MTKTKTPKAASFDDWVEMWEKAQSDGTFADAPKPPPANNPGSYFGMQYAGADAELPPSEADTAYWNQVYQRSNNAGDAPDVASPILTEQKKSEKVEKKSEKVRKKRRVNEATTPEDMKRVAQAQLRSPNPIYYYSAGKDQDPHVTPNWSSGKELDELTQLKGKLHELEVKVSTMIGAGKPDRQVQKLEAELRKLRTRMDELSDSLHGGWSGEAKD